VWRGGARSGVAWRGVAWQGRAGLGVAWLVIHTLVLLALRVRGHVVLGHSRRSLDQEGGRAMSQHVLPVWVRRHEVEEVQLHLVLGGRALARRVPDVAALEAQQRLIIQPDVPLAIQLHLRPLGDRLRQPVALVEQVQPLNGGQRLGVGHGGRLGVQRGRGRIGGGRHLARVEAYFLLDLGGIHRLLGAHEVRSRRPGTPPRGYVSGVAEAGRTPHGELGKGSGRLVHRTTQSLNEAAGPVQGPPNLPLDHGDLPHGLVLPERLDRLGLPAELVRLRNRAADPLSLPPSPLSLEQIRGGKNTDVVEEEDAVTPLLLPELLGPDVGRPHLSGHPQQEEAQLSVAQGLGSSSGRRRRKHFVNVNIHNIIRGQFYINFFFLKLSSLIFLS